MRERVIICDVLFVSLALSLVDDFVISDRAKYLRLKDFSVDFEIRPNGLSMRQISKKLSIRKVRISIYVDFARTF